MGYAIQYGDSDDNILALNYLLTWRAEIKYIKSSVKTYIA
jgi:hypothetical protein